MSFQNRAQLLSDVVPFGVLIQAFRYGDRTASGYAGTQKSLFAENWVFALKIQAKKITKCNMDMPDEEAKMPFSSVTRP
jgi:hypothetical protein